ncbi:NAD(P)-dependent oxidoreductase [Kaistia dalseonensis]|uniref:UDP-glucuronate 4-epimerase n=1 Tax=Kaistia dalseonensis TaxID=410840 RepID=A0ABU0HAD1_9HYPH|nr:NAD(P)-dependent oxidoreductase [Kaistia dalseonensis]MCX5496122.1 NAD(P)-dependent oxidoreductase [Kaistia dalseonensis]MDQ0438730.1 UDP-glucuronate 4-epimerase [Kaistia dalseonensis]
MTILVTGSSGFVGLNIVEHLLAEGRNVVGIADRDLPAIARFEFAGLPGHYIGIVADVRQESSIRRIMGEHNVTRVIHAAAITSNAARERTQASQTVGVNLGGLTAVASAAAQHGVERFVFVSSNAIFGGGTPDYELLHEDYPKNPGNIYALSKWTGEMILEKLGASAGLDWVAGRLAGVFGPWEYRTGLRDTMNPVFQANTLAFDGAAATLPRPGRSNWHFSRDAASALSTLLLAPAHQHRIYNLGTPYVWSIGDWCERLAGHFPQFTISVGEGEGSPIDLYGDSDGGILSGARFTEEFGPTGTHDLDAAFDHLMNWHEAHGFFGLERSAA